MKLDYRFLSFILFACLVWLVWDYQQSTQLKHFAESDLKFQIREIFRKVDRRSKLREELNQKVFYRMTAEQKNDFYLKIGIENVSRDWAQAFVRISSTDTGHVCAKLILHKMDSKWQVAELLPMTTHQKAACFNNYKFIAAELSAINEAPISAESVTIETHTQLSSHRFKIEGYVVAAGFFYQYDMTLTKKNFEWVNEKAHLKRLQ